VNIIQRWIRGFSLPWQAWGELRAVKGRRFIFLPIMLNVTFAYLLFRYGLTGYLIELVVPMVDARLNDSWQWLVTVVRFFLDALALFAVTLLAVRLGTIIGSPFYAAVAERIDRAYLPSDDTPDQSIVQSIGGAVWFELRKWSLFVPLSLCGFALEFIPVVGAVVGTLWFVSVGGTMALLDYTDASLSRRFVPFRQRLRIFIRHFPEVFGFACAVVPLAGIPLLNVLTVPLCVSAGVLLYVRYLRHGVQPSVSQ
jgi:CysZ protein